MGMFKKDEPLGEDPSDVDRQKYEEHIRKEDAGVRTSWQYQRFKSPIYPKLERGFPRRYADITPQEILYDPTRILGRGIRARLIPTGETMLNQPRVEAERMIQLDRTDCPTTQAPFECPPPFSQLPVIKKQTHLEPSRDAEIFRRDGCVDVPASVDGVVPGVATVMSFDTFINLDTIIKWTQMLVYDALCPSLVTVTFRQDGAPLKWMASSSGSTVGSNSNTYTTVSSQGGQDLQCIPDFQNTLIEIVDRHHIDVVASNLAMVDRKVEVCLWGWIESVTMWNQAVKH